MEAIGTAPLPSGLTVNKAIAMWQAGNTSGTISSESFQPDFALFGAGEMHGMTPTQYRRPRAPKVPFKG